MQSYSIMQGPDGKWIIVNPANDNLAWAGSHWFFRDESGPPLTSFSDKAAAERYAVAVFGAQYELYLSESINGGTNDNASS